MAALNGNSPELFSLVDEDGVQQEFEMIDKMEIDGAVYYALVPCYDDPAEDLESDGELVVLKSEYEGNEEFLVSIDDDDEYDRIGNMFIERLNVEFEEE